jgi:hypothetical protein
MELKWKAMEFLHTLPRILPKALILIPSKANWRCPYNFTHIF